MVFSYVACISLWISGCMIVRVAIGKSLKLSPTFPSPHTVRATFTAYGAPSIYKLIYIADMNCLLLQFTTVYHLPFCIQIFRRPFQSYRNPRQVRCRQLLNIQTCGCSSGLITRPSSVVPLPSLLLRILPSVARFVSNFTRRQSLFKTTPEVFDVPFRLLWIQFRCLLYSGSGSAACNSVMQIAQKITLYYWNGLFHDPDSFLNRQLIEAYIRKFVRFSNHSHHVESTAYRTCPVPCGLLLLMAFGYFLSTTGLACMFYPALHVKVCPLYAVGNLTGLVSGRYSFIPNLV